MGSLGADPEARTGARLSGHQLAEWLTWNWWRLRWEPGQHNTRRDRCIGWRQTHDLGGVGGGWLRSNVMVTNEGLRVVLDARRSRGALRYVAGGGRGFGGSVGGRGWTIS